MTEVASLFLIVVLVYLLQCICWVPPRAIIFALGFRGRGNRRKPGFIWNALDTAGLLANPLPPLTPLVVQQWPAFELTPDSIKFPGKTGELVVISWEKLEVSHSEGKLSCNGSLVFKGSEAQVQQYTQLLDQLRRARRGQREQIIQTWLRKMAGGQTPTRRLLVFAKRSRWLRVFSNFQFFFLFVLAPLAFREFGTRVFWRVILILVVISIAIALEFWSVHKELFPRARDTRFKAGLVVLLSPMAAIRASDVVARDLLSGYHPVAAAGAVLSEEEFRRFAAEQLRLCRFGDYLDKQFQRALTNAVEGAIAQRGIVATELLLPPEAESGCVVYCPRCLAQYTKTREACSDCGYEVLATLAPAQESAKARKRAD